jgi:hypothetical protein
MNAAQAELKFVLEVANQEYEGKNSLSACIDARGVLFRG